MLRKITSVVLVSLVDSLILHNGTFKLLLLLVRSTIVMDGDLLSKLCINVLEAATFGLRAHEVDEENVEEGWYYEDEEELPLDLVQADRAGNQDNDVGEIETHHTEGSTLTANVSWEYLGAGSNVSGSTTR